MQFDMINTFVHTYAHRCVHMCVLENIVGLHVHTYICMQVY